MSGGRHATNDHRPPRPAAPAVAAPRETSILLDDITFLLAGKLDLLAASKASASPTLGTSVTGDLLAFMICQSKDSAMTTFQFLSVCTAGAIACAFPALAQDTPESAPQTGEMTAYSDMAVVDGSSASLARMEHGLYADVETSGLTAGDAVTLLWVLFNDPAQCSDGACGGDDIFNMAEGKVVPDPDGSAPMNTSGIEAAKVSLLRADGRVVGEDGTVALRSHLPIGDTSEAAFGPGLIDPKTAEVHLVIRSHGPNQPDLTSEMLNTINGGCAKEWPNAPCRNAQFVAFKPF